MRRRDISKALFATVTGSAVVARQADAQTCTAPCYTRTAAEIAAGVTPTNYAYAPGPLIDVRRYGWSSTNTAAQNATALNTAISISQTTVTSGNYGATIQLPPGAYALNPVVVPAYTIIRGTGQRSTILQWTSGGANTLFTLGGTSGTVTNSPGVSDFSVQLTGKGEMKALKIDPSLFKEDQVEILEDLIVTAHNDAKAKADSAMQQRMGEMTQGLPLPPGMKLPF